MESSAKEEKIALLCKRTDVLLRRILLIYPVALLAYFSEGAVLGLSKFKVVEWLSVSAPFIHGFEGDDYESFRYRVMYSWLYFVVFVYTALCMLMFLRDNYVNHFSKNKLGYFYLSCFGWGLLLVYPVHGDTHIANALSYSGYVGLVVNSWLLSGIVGLALLAPMSLIAGLFIRLK